MPPTSAPVNVLLKGVSMAGAKRLVKNFGGSGTLGLLANNFTVFQSGGNEGPMLGIAGASDVYTVGNILGARFLAEAPFVVSGGVQAVSTGDLWWTESHPGYGSEFLSGDTFATAGVPVPNGLTFTAESGRFRLPSTGTTVRPFVSFTPPRISNLGSLMVNVRDFGAVGDGSTDDYAAIMRAIESLRESPTGGFAQNSLYFPPGRYRVSQPVLLDHWAGGGFFGDGEGVSVIVNSSGDSAWRTNGSGYTTFAGLGFETSSTDNLAFDLSWDGTPAEPTNGGALQAHMLYGVRFQGGLDALAIAGGGYMGSESLIVDSVFRDADRGLSVNAYNALANVVVNSQFENLRIGAYQSAGTYNIYNSTMREIGEAGTVMRNSASDAFVLDHILYEDADTPLIYQGNLTCAPIVILAQGITLASAPGGPGTEFYAAGSVVLLDSNLGGHVIYSGSSMCSSALVLDSASASTSDHSVGHKAREFSLNH